VLKIQNTSLKIPENPQGISIFRLGNCLNSLMVNQIIFFQLNSKTDEKAVENKFYLQSQVSIL